MRQIIGKNSINVLDDPESTKYEIVSPAGTTLVNFESVSIEDLLAVAVDKLGVTQARLPKREVALAITKVEEALLWLGKVK